MEKNFDAAAENQIYELWKKSGKMRADPASPKEKYTIVLPPPNITAKLHLGHAAMIAIEDTLIRFQKMRGREVLWVPGTDHAAIATETVVLKNLGISDRNAQISRTDFLKEAQKFVQITGGIIKNQIEKLGAWLDWSREAYTFDAERSDAVNFIFKKLFDDGLIYRGARLINWSSGAQSVISDDELEWDEVSEPFYFLRCGEFVVGTVRPETKCAHSPVVLHPNAIYARVQIGKETFVISENAAKNPKILAKIFSEIGAENAKVLETFAGKTLIGQKFQAETFAGSREFEVICDEVIDAEKGSGMMTISCHHSADDFDLLQRRAELKKYAFDKIAFDGKMLEVAGDCAGMEVEKARTKAAEIMRQKNLLLGADAKYSHRVPKCYRSQCTIEPMVSPQWFVAVEKEFDHFGQKTTLKKILQDAVRQNAVEILPARFEKIYFQWADNLRDWCISRQIWWGHRIPVWYDDSGAAHLPREQKFVFIRHGQSVANNKQIIQPLDSPLSEKGRADAEKIFENLKHRPIAKIITSPTTRSRETAEILARKFGLEIEILPEISAADCGNAFGTPIEKMGSSIAIEFANQNKTGEKIDDFFARNKKGLEKIKQMRADGEILVIGHRSNFSAIFDTKTPADFIANRHRNKEVGYGIFAEKTFLQPPIGKNLKQDEDTLDTWFSSALWPFSTLSWPDANHPDFKAFYPNSVMETGHDILFFWVARMILFGKYATGVYPFKHVYLHGMVCDAHGAKMSKTKGNGIDPLEMIEKFGADPVRLSLLIGTAPGQNIPVGEAKISGFRHFVNKVWNAGRFVQMQVSDSQKFKNLPEPQNLAEKWILSKFSQVCKSVAEDLESFRISAAGDQVYHFVWDDFCDWFIESAKLGARPEFLTPLFGQILKLVHPIAPFVSEKVWSELFPDAGFLVDQSFPSLDFADSAAVAEFETVQEVVCRIRKLRADKKLNPKNTLQIWGQLPTGEGEKLIEILAKVARGIEKNPPENAAKIAGAGFEIWIEIPADQVAEKAEKEKLQKQIAALQSRLASPNYVQKAPANLVQQTRENLQIARENLAKLEG